MMKKITLLTALAGACFVGACGDDDGATDAGPDAEILTDASLTQDAAPFDGDLVDAAPPEDTNPSDAGPSDAGPDADDDAGPTTCEELAPTQGRDDLIISQYNMAGGMIEFFNPTDADIPLDGYVLCKRPAYETITGSGVTVPAGGYAEYMPSAGFRTPMASSGELALYDSTAYDSRNSMIDFVCWGTAPTATRKPVAERMLGSEVLWMGDCAPAPTMGAVSRNVEVAGTSAADYDNAAAYMAHTCE